MLSRPGFYGFAYFALIPIYATIYFWFPGVLKDEHSFLECLYFSTVTITTLGYGDITPTGWLGQVATASEALLGIILIGLFLNATASAKGERARTEQEDKEMRSYINGQRARLNGHYRLIEPIIEKYKQSVSDIIRPAGQFSQHYNPDFMLNDMKDMYKPTILARAPLMKPAIEVYCEVADELHREIASLIMSIDLKHFPEIENLCQEIIGVNNLDYSEMVLSVLHTKAGNAPMTETIEKMLQNYSGDHTLYSSANLLNGYILLRHQIRTIMDCLPRLESAMKKELDNFVLPTQRP